MPRLSLTAAQRTQLQAWVDQINAALTDAKYLTYLSAEARAELEAELSLFPLILSKDGSNVRLQDLTAAQRDEARWLRDTIAADIAAGRTLSGADSTCRTIWDFLGGL